MRVILLSGGSGKRLWPLSNNSKPKPFLKVLQTEKNEWESMLQRVWRQLTLAGLSDVTWIAANKSHVDTIVDQVGMEVPMIQEQWQMDTFPAIALAAVQLFSTQACSPDENIVVLPVDLYVEQMFFDRLKQLERCMNDLQSNIGLIGVRPTYPSEEYGYIVPCDGAKGDYLPVCQFIEKPSKDVAQQLIEQSALWNCGVFSFKLGFLIDQLIQMGLPVKYEDFVEHYTSLPKRSFDYVIVEKQKNTTVLPYDGLWKDLGTWEAVTEQLDDSIIGIGAISDGCNANIINKLNIPIHVIGLSNIVVVAGPQGILIAHKQDSHQIKKQIEGG